MSANGIGGAVAAQIITPIINNGETFGYRKAYLLSAAIALATGIAIMVFLREHPEDTSVQYKKVKKALKGNIWTGIDYSIVYDRKQ